jgi:hypothetical protein
MRAKEYCLFVFISGPIIFGVLSSEYLIGRQEIAMDIRPS